MTRDEIGLQLVRLQSTLAHLVSLLFWICSEGFHSHSEEQEKKQQLITNNKGHRCPLWHLKRWRYHHTVT